MWQGIIGLCIYIYIYRERDNDIGKAGELRAHVTA